MAVFKKIISKLSGSPFVNIPQWLYEVTKIIVPNRFKPTQIKTSKEKKIHIPSLAKTLIGIRNKINSLIAEVNRIPKYEIDTEIRLKQIEAEIKTLQGVDKTLQGVDKTLSTKGHIHPPNSGGPIGPSLSRKGGKLLKGGRTRTKPKPIRRKSQPISQGNCSEERQMLQSLDGLSLEQMLAKLNGYLSNHKPCINIKPKRPPQRTFNGGGSSSRNQCAGACGDINADGLINILDVVAQVNMVLNGGYDVCADVNGDGNLDVLDVVILVGAILGGNIGGWTGSCPTDDVIIDTLGCTNPTACNYCGADVCNIDDGSCMYVECEDGTCVESESDCDGDTLELIGPVYYVNCDTSACGSDPFCCGSFAGSCDQYCGGAESMLYKQYFIRVDSTHFTETDLNVYCMNQGHEGGMDSYETTSYSTEELYDGFYDASEDPELTPYYGTSYYRTLNRDGYGDIPDDAYWSTNGKAGGGTFVTKITCFIDLPGCQGIIGCDSVCDPNASVVEQLDGDARWDAAGVCGGGVYAQHPVCQSYSDNMDDCPLSGTGDTDITYMTSETETINGEVYHISVPDDYYHCIWSFGDDCVPAGWGRKGGKLKKSGRTTAVPSRQHLLPEKDPPKPEERIVGGAEAIPNSYPFMVSIQKSSTTDRSMYHSCGGILIHREWVLTAAHCFCVMFPTNCMYSEGVGYPSGNEWVFLGAHALSEVMTDEDDGIAQLRNIDGLVPHLDYYQELPGVGPITHDFALLHLSEPATPSDTVQIKMLPENPVFYSDGTDVVLIGWGHTESGGEISDELREVETQIDASCGVSFGAPDEDLVVCAGGGGAGTCQGDSGGPLLEGSVGNIGDLVGITSYGTCADTPGKYSRITSDVVEWINDIIGLQCGLPQCCLHLDCNEGEYCSENGFCIQCDTGGSFEPLCCVDEMYSIDGDCPCENCDYSGDDCSFYTDWGDCNEHTDCHWCIDDSYCIPWTQNCPFDDYVPEECGGGCSGTYIDWDSEVTMNCNSNWSEGQCTSPPCCDLNYMLNSCIWNQSSVTDCTGVCGGSAELDECGVCEGDGSTCVGETPGCTDPDCSNYNPDATINNGSCTGCDGDEDTGQTCGDGIYPNNDEGTTCLDGSCCGDNWYEAQGHMCCDWDVVGGCYNNTQGYCCYDQPSTEYNQYGNSVLSCSLLTIDEDCNSESFRCCSEPKGVDNPEDALWADWCPVTCGNCCTGVCGGCSLGDMNGDGGWNVLDIVLLANIVLSEVCTSSAAPANCCAGDLNGDGGWNVLDVVILSNCVLAENCGGDHINRHPEWDKEKWRYDPPEGMSELDHTRIIQEIVNAGKDINRIKSILEKEVPIHIKGSGISRPIGRMQKGGFTKPKLSKKQLQSMSVEQLEETKIQLQSKPKSMRAGGTIKIGDVVKDMNST